LINIGLQQTYFGDVHERIELVFVLVLQSIAAHRNGGRADVHVSKTALLINAGLVLLPNLVEQ
jgi:hypothetical protein